MKTPKTSTYSGKPLPDKLGIKEGQRVLLMGAPEDYESLLAPLPPAVQFVKRPDKAVDLVQIFVTDKEELSTHLNALRQKLKPDAVLWVSWPKKSAGVPTTVTEDTIRELAIPLGFVDIKVCAVTEVWSGLKLMVRKDLRGDKQAKQAV